MPLSLSEPEPEAVVACWAAQGGGADAHGHIWIHLDILSQLARDPAVLVKVYLDGPRAIGVKQ